MYVDSSIKFISKKIKPSLTVALRNGISSQTLTYLNLTCYTDPGMFKWFKETPEDYSNVPSLEANIIFFKKSVLTALVMKAWVTCALDKTCIEPPGI